MKRILIAIFTAVVVCGFGGCKADEKQNEVSETSQINISKISENGWTPEDVANVFYINNTPIKLPFTIADLGDEYSINEQDTQILDSGACGTTLYYQGTPFLILNYVNVQEYNQLFDKNIQSISTLYNDKNSDFTNEFVSINGIMHGDTMDKVEKTFGTPNEKNDNSLIYTNSNTSDNMLGFLFNENGQLYTITLILE